MKHSLTTKPLPATAWYAGAEKEDAAYLIQLAKGRADALMLTQTLRLRLRL